MFMNSYMYLRLDYKDKTKYKYIGASKEQMGQQMTLNFVTT